MRVDTVPQPTPAALAALTRWSPCSEYDEARCEEFCGMQPNEIGGYVLFSDVLALLAAARRGAGETEMIDAVVQAAYAEGQRDADPLATEQERQRASATRANAVAALCADRCLTLGDGSCVSESRCMHDAPAGGA